MLSDLPCNTNTKDFPTTTFDDDEEEEPEYVAINHVLPLKAARRDAIANFV